MKSKARFIGPIIFATSTFIMISVISTISSGAALPTGPPSSSGTTAPTSAIPHPVNVPSGPVGNVSDCPANPELSSALPVGATISAPTLAPSIPASTSGATATNIAGSCVYTEKVPASDLGSTSASNSQSASPDTITISWINDGNDYAPANTDFGPIDFFNYYGDACAIDVELVDLFGYGWAGLELDSGHCNTNSTGVWSNVTAINTGLSSGANLAVNTFHTMQYASVPGNLFFGEYSICLESPLGQQSDYVCTAVNFSPLF